VNDPEAVGMWESVDFVSRVDDFKPDSRCFKGGLFLKELSVLEGGKTNGVFTWTKGLIIHCGNKTAAKYYIKEVDGARYMFFEWLSGDYTIRQMKPKYYVLKRIQPGTN
jgi:bla regulator protein BlaR1